MNSPIENRERGIALLIVLFGLVLLSVIGLGMMYSTNMETAINSNYRDKQAALYAALGGLQEARDRIQPATHNIVAPTALPSTAAQNVIYIVSDYATVKPWDPTNAYFDTELCQEHVLGLTGTPGTPCTTIASGTNWFSYVDDSQTTSAPWNLTNPLDLKWTRITLKGNNMTPVAVNGDSSSSDQTCWNGTNQMSTPTGYSTGCMPVGGVTAVTVITSGSGYTSAPTVTLSGGGGTGATATATTQSVTTTDGVVTSISVTTGGTGYTSTPTVSLSGGGGSGAAATAHTASLTTTSGYVNSVTLTAGGNGFTSVPTVTISGGGGTGATATVTVNTSSSVGTLVLDTAGGKCYASGSPPTVAFSGGGGSGAAATATLAGTPSCVYDWTLSGNCAVKMTAGNGYNPIDEKAGVTFTSGNQSFSGTLYVQAANDKTVLSHPACCGIQDPGTGYTANFSSTLRLPSGVWPDCNNLTTTTTVGYAVASITLTSAGTGYASAPAVSFGGSGVGSAVSGPTAHTTIGATAVLGITLTNGGSGYTSAPTVTISGGGGSGATATATVQTTSTSTYYVDTITVDSGGSAYASAPTVTISGGGGSGALATASITTSSTTTYYVDQINVTASGSGYTSNPTVTLSGGGGGTGATASSTISGGTQFGQVWLLTSLAQTRTGARSMVQMEVASPVLGRFALGGALTLDGPNPVIDAMPNSNNFMITGADANSCHETAEPDHPAIDGFDDPNANPPTASVQTITGSLPRPDHYTGSGGTPSVQNGYGSLGETMTTPTGLKGVIDAIRVAPGAHYYDSSTVGSFNPSSTTNSSITYVEGDLSLGGSSTGRGILVVTGTLSLSGNFSWYGIIFVVGDGVAGMNGGGNGQIVGSIFIAKIWDSYATKNLLNSVGSPTLSWNGGGGNGISYDHCYATNLMNAVPFTPAPSTSPLKILSTRILPY